MVYRGDTKFSYTACQWTEAQAMETGKHIHHKMCGHDGERMVKVWVLNDKAKKEPVTLLVDGYESEAKTVYHFMDVVGMGIHVKRIVQKDSKRGIKIRVRLIGLSKIMDGIQNITLRQLGNVRNQY